MSAAVSPSGPPSFGPYDVAVLAKYGGYLPPDLARRPAVELARMIARRQLVVRLPLVRVHVSAAPRPPGGAARRRRTHRRPVRAAVSAGSDPPPSSENTTTPGMPSGGGAEHRESPRVRTTRRTS